MSTSFVATKIFLDHMSKVPKDLPLQESSISLQLGTIAYIILALVFIVMGIVLMLSKDDKDLLVPSKYSAAVEQRSRILNSLDEEVHHEKSP